MSTNRALAAILLAGSVSAMVAAHRCVGEMNEDGSRLRVVAFVLLAVSGALMVTG